MSLKVFHTGDIHIGMKYSNYSGEVRNDLVEARFLTLEHMINKSNELNTDIFVVAGDLFNSIQITKRDIQRTARILNQFNGACVLVLPGNHDYDDGLIDLWREFNRFSGEKILLVNEKKPYNLESHGLDTIIYGAPCHNKHSEENSVGWIKEEGLLEDGKYHIGIGHGALEGLSPDIEGNYYYMDMEELNSIPVDLWLLGHTHVSFPLEAHINNHRIYNAGTPEPDGLNYKDEGSAWFIELVGEKVHAQKITTGRYRFYDQEFTLKSDEDLGYIKDWLAEGESSQKVVRLTLKGSISKDSFERVNEFYRELESLVFYLIIIDSELKIKVDRDIIEKEFTRGSFPFEFLTSLEHDKEALQIAYDIIRGR